LSEALPLDEAISFHSSSLASLSKADDVVLSSQNRRRMKVKLGKVIATRILVLKGRQKKMINVYLGAPQKVGQDWACPYRIVGLERPKTGYSFGVDAFQALALMSESIRATLEATGKKFFWLDGAPWDLAFPRTVPVITESLTRRLYRLIDKELKQFVRKAEARHRRRLNRNL